MRRQRSIPYGSGLRLHGEQALQGMRSLGTPAPVPRSGGKPLPGTRRMQIQMRRSVITINHGLTLSNWRKVGASASSSIYRCIQLTADIPFCIDCIEIPKPRLFVADHVSQNISQLSEFVPTAKNIFRQFVLMRHLRACSKSRPHFRDCMRWRNEVAFSSPKNSDRYDTVNALLSSIRSIHAQSK